MTTCPDEPCIVDQYHSTVQSTVEAQVEDLVPAKGSRRLRALEREERSLVGAGGRRRDRIAKVATPELSPPGAKLPDEITDAGRRFRRRAEVPRLGVSDRVG